MFNKSIKNRTMRIEKKLEKKAERLFDSFNLNEIDIVSFENSLINLSNEFVTNGFWDEKVVVEAFVPCLKEQFADYKNGDLNLLRCTNEGSLAQNFKCKLI